jgi:hypothetical protein
MAVNVEIKGLAELQAQLKRLAETGIAKSCTRWLVTWGMRISADTQRRLQRGGRGRFTGRLANSYSSYPASSEGGVEITQRNAEVILRVGSNVAYARYVEGWPRAPRRHFLPYKGHPGFVRWARSVAKVPWSAIRRGGMMVGGQKSIRPALGPALEQNIPLMNSQIDRLLDTAVE